VTVSSTSVTLPATGTTTLTLHLSGGTELKVPWWVRIGRQGKP
jgi:hypothetical protein